MRLIHLLYTLITLFAASGASAQMYRKVCVQMGEISCIEWYEAELRMSDLAPWYYTPIDPTPPTTGTTVEAKEEEIEHEFKEKIETDFSEYGKGVAYSMATLVQKYNQFKMEDEKVEDALRAIRYRAKNLREKEGGITKDYVNSIPSLHKQIDEINADLDRSLEEHTQDLVDLSKEVDKQIEENPAIEGDKVSDMPMERMEFESKDQLLSDKRERLLKDHAPTITNEVAQNIYHTSGKLQAQSREAYAEQDYDSAFLGQDLAMGLVDFGLGLTPVVGDGIALYEAFMGKSPVTGAQLSGTERIISGATGLLGLASFGTLGAVARGIAKGSKALKYSEGAVKAFSTAGKYIEGASKLGLKTRAGVREFIDVGSRVIGNDIGAVGDLTKFVGGKLTRFNPLTRGPLSDIASGSGTIADTFRSSTYFKVALEEPTKLYRVFDENTGQLARYWSRVKPTGPLQATFDSALDPSWGNSARKWVEITVPAGEEFFEGIVAEVALRRGSRQVSTGQLLGGGSQVFVNRKIPTKWITDGGDF